MATTWINPVDFNKSLNQGLAEGSYTGSAIPLIMGGTGTQAASANAAFNALSPLTTGGDLLYGGASGVGTRLANGSSGQVLTSGGGTSAPMWAAAGTPVSYATTATAAGTTTLIVSSAVNQFFTGVTTQIVLLPVTSTLTLGQYFKVVNNSTGAVTVQSSGANSVAVVSAGSSLLFTAILLTGTTAASWATSL